MPPQQLMLMPPGPQGSGAPAFWSGDDRQRAQALLSLIYQAAAI